MTFLGHSPRPVYRIYAEEEFLAAADWRQEPQPAPVNRCTPARPWGRLAGVTALSATFAALLGVVALDAMRSTSPTRRRIAFVNTARGSSLQRRAPKALRTALQVPPSSSVPRYTPRRARAPRVPRVAPLVFPRVAPGATRSGELPLVIPRVAPGAARSEELPASTPSPPPAVGAAPAATAAAPATPATAATVVAAKAAAAPPPAARHEFGFER